jgi:transposase InsO family protein
MLPYRRFADTLAGACAQLTHILTDRGSCFTADLFENACADLKISRRMTRPYTPQTNGMVERFNGRIASEVLGINVGSHADLETLLVGFNHAYNRRRQSALLGMSPNNKVHQRLKLASTLANPLYTPTNSAIMDKVDDVLYHANDVSPPDS